MVLNHKLDVMETDVFDKFPSTFNDSKEITDISWIRSNNKIFKNFKWKNSVQLAQSKNICTQKQQAA